MNNNLTVIDTTDLNREEWLAVRRRYIGGSDAPIIQGKSKFSSCFELAHDKLGLSGNKPESDEMRYGSRLEPVIFSYIPDDFKRLTGGDIELIHDKNMYIAADNIRSANIDGRCIINGEEGIVEIKAPGSYAVSDWKDGVPEYYQDQAYHYMDVLGLEFTIFCAWCGAKPFFHILLSDKERQEEIRQKEIKFYNDVIVNRVLPEPTFRDEDFIKSLTGTDETIAYIDEQEEILNRITEIKYLMKRLTAEDKRLQVKIRKACGKAKQGMTNKYIVSNGNRFTIKKR